ncbi:hypothetical protein ACFFGT_32515 [Mucilaginibacter angelicae]|uniref:Cthe-2314-like HEPN domain-containing protein n=1 Tax=Mucilaginibacter angelicae TaxID=869718 RepID=A0ABV6LHL6_9SPHI
MAIKITDYEDNLKEMHKAITGSIRDFQKLSEEHFLSGEYADWHIKGLIYHVNNLIASYREVVKELELRLNTVSEADIFIMHTPQINNLMYEFYAFVSLARITLDNLRYILYPLFVNNMGQMPKSITDLEKNKTDCSVYQRIADTQELQYLIDLRNCIVHYKTFATSNNSVIVKEGLNINLEDYTGNKWTVPMAKGMYRITENRDIVFNIFLPDNIYDRTSNGKKLCVFTYDKRINILGESVRFLRYIVFNYMEALILNISSQEKRFNYNKSASFANVKYLDLKF